MQRLDWDQGMLETAKRCHFVFKPGYSYSWSCPEGSGLEPTCFIRFSGPDDSNFVFFF